MVRAAQIRDRGELVGRLENESMLELVAETIKSKAPMYLWLKFMGEEGHFYFREGKIVAAACRSLRGRQAAYNLLAFRSGIFRLVRGQKPPAENVEIVWSDFEKSYQEELHKLIVSFMHSLEGKFVFRVLDCHHQEIYAWEDTHSEHLQKLLKKLFDAGAEDGFKLLVRGLEDQITESREGIFAAIFYIPELRYFLAAAGEGGEKEKIINWIRYEFIPLSREAVSVSLRKADRLARRAGILAVIPDPELAEHVSSPLHAAGFKVWVCQDGFEGLVRTEDYHPDLILLYHDLKRIIAPEVFQRLKRKEQSQMIPVISLVEEGEREKAQAEPCGDIYLAIPFSAKKLIKEVENILELK
jgi:CheY-like chemotaxis protein